MIATTHETSSRLRVLTRLGCRGSVIGGLLFPWAIMLAVEVVVHQVPVARAWRSFTLHLFAPGYNFFLIGLLTAVPFVILAVLMLFYRFTPDIKRAGPILRCCSIRMRRGRLPISICRSSCWPVCRSGTGWDASSPECSCRGLPLE